MTVYLSAQGKLYSSYVSGMVKRCFSDICAHFEFIFIGRGEFYADQEVDVYVENTKVMSGYIERIFSYVSEGVLYTSISGREITRDIEDSSCPIISFEGPISGSDVINQIISRVNPKLQLNEVVSSGTFSGGCVAKIGESLISFFERYFLKKKVLMSSSYESEFLITKNTGLTQSYDLVVGENVLERTYEENTSRLFKTYKSFSQSNNFSGDFPIKSIGSSGGSSKTRDRLFLVGSESDDNECSGLSSWSSVINRSLSKKIKIKVANHSKNGNILKVGSSLSFKDDVLSLTGNKFVFLVCWSTTERCGDKAEITLLDGDSFK